MTATDEDTRARLHMLSTALDLPGHRLLSRECQDDRHNRCDGSARALRLHPMAQHQERPGLSYDQPLPCFCGCHELFRPT